MIGKIGSGGFGIVYLVCHNSEKQQQQPPQQQQQQAQAKTNNPATKGVFAMKVIDKVR